ncbi:MAG: amidase family protein, partial [Acidimicrobiia bacterium]
VRRLRQAGCSVVGKTAMDEFAYCEPPATTNPLDSTRTPGGSSGGSAAAVAAGMCDLAIGSQTLQSTIVPAAYCGIVGFKPTFDRLPFDGVPLAPSFDTVGLFTPTVADLVAAVAALDPDWRANAPAARRLGIPTPWGRAAHAEAWRRFNLHTRLLNDADIELVPCDVPWNDDQVFWAEAVGDLLRGEMARIHERWFRMHRKLYRPRTAAAVEVGMSVTDERLAECRQIQAEAIAALSAQMDRLDLDGFACPSAADVAPVGYDLTGDSWMTCFWSFARFPAVSVPVVDSDEVMPRGLQLIGGPGGDERLLATALAVTHAHRGT